MLEDKLVTMLQTIRQFELKVQNTYDITDDDRVEYAKAVLTKARVEDFFDKLAQVKE